MAVDLNEIVDFILSGRLYFCVLDKSEVVSKSSLIAPILMAVLGVKIQKRYRYYTLFT
jgi:hypothetical protein